MRAARNRQHTNSRGGASEGDGEDDRGQNGAEGGGALQRLRARCFLSFCQRGVSQVSVLWRQRCGVTRGEDDGIQGSAEELLPAPAHGQR